MKMGVRKPSIKKSISARTTGKINRSMKSAINPVYGKKGMGMITNPKKAIYNRVYSKTTISAIPPIRSNKDMSRTEEHINVNNGKKAKPETAVPMGDTTSEPAVKEKASKLKRILEVIALVTMIYGIAKLNFVLLLITFIILIITNFIIK